MSVSIFLSIEYNSYSGSLVMGIALPLLTGPPCGI